MGDIDSKWNVRYRYSKKLKTMPEAKISDGKPMKEIEPFLKMIENGQDSEMLRFTIGNAYFKEKRFVEAVQHLEQAVALKPDYSAAWKMLGRSLAEDERYEDALKAFDQGLSVAEQNGDKQTEKEIQVFRKRVTKALEQ